MKRLILLLASGCLFFAASAQQAVFDRQYFSSVTVNQAVRSSAEETHHQYLGKINSDIGNININIGAVVLAQTMIYNSLSNVNSVLKNGLAVKNMAFLTQDIISYLTQALELAKDEPYLLLFASNIENEIRTKAVGLLTDVSGCILQSGGKLLADYNGRDQLLRNVTQRLQVLDGLAYGAWKTMYWAGQKSLAASLNPFQSYISKDRFFAQEIIQNARFLRQ